MSGFYGEVDNAPAGYGQGNAGFSGTPLWKLKQHGLVPGPSVPQVSREEQQEQEKQLEELQVAKVLVDSATLGGPSATDKLAKPYVRHVHVKDLRKVAARTKLALPTTGLFDQHAPVALFALFDGQSCADAPSSPGTQAAEWCCKHAHSKLIRNLMALQPEQAGQTPFLKAALIKTFEDLDRELLTSQPGVQDGCGAALALLVGQTLLTAVVGRCGMFMIDPAPLGAEEAGEAEKRVHGLGSNQGRCDLPGEAAYFQQQGGVVLPASKEGIGGEPVSCVRTPTGLEAAVSRSLGDRAWKSIEAGGSSVLPLLRSVPEVTAMPLSYAAGCPALVLSSSPVAEAVRASVLAEAVEAFSLRPRAASGEVAQATAVQLAGGLAAASQGGSPGEGKSSSISLQAQCTAVTVFFLPPDFSSREAKAAEQPAVKKAKTGPGGRGAEVQSLRLRHILVRHRDCNPAHDPVRGKAVTRTQQEAEAMLRPALRELLQEQREQLAKSKTAAGNSKKDQMGSVTPSPKYIALCKRLSECQSSSKGGVTCGDIGWVSSEELRTFGPTFTEVVRGLSIGQWSDLVCSSQGMHVIQRIA